MCHCYKPHKLPFYLLKKIKYLPKELMTICSTYVCDFHDLSRKGLILPLTSSNNPVNHSLSCSDSCIFDFSYKFKEYIPISLPQIKKIVITIKVLSNHKQFLTHMIDDTLYVTLSEGYPDFINLYPNVTDIYVSRGRSIYVLPLLSYCLTKSLNKLSIHTNNEQCITDAVSDYLTKYTLDTLIMGGDSLAYFGKNIPRVIHLPQLNDIKSLRRQAQYPANPTVLVTNVTAPACDILNLHTSKRLKHIHVKTILEYKNYFIQRDNVTLSADTVLCPYILTLGKSYEDVYPTKGVYR